MPQLQSAYHHSTETALLKVLSDMYVAVDRQQVTLLGILDLAEITRSAISSLETVQSQNCDILGSAKVLLTLILLCCNVIECFYSYTDVTKASTDACGTTAAAAATSIA